ncbi:MAG TPA: GNAT family N-acetyltransferase [Blastocatellia bacterium]|nr:GNAT family N-acetyltransferase [Blastocatellia bacterium]
MESSSSDRSQLLIDALRPEDWEQVRSIYLEGIATGHATFETAAPEWEQWDAAHLRFARLVAKTGGSVAGWAALSPVSSRWVYGGVAEVSVYVANSDRGKGVGKLLLRGLIEQAERNNIWTLQAGIFPENIASVELHRSCGFREVGRRERLAKLNGTWRDVLLFERRSKVVGAG